MTGPVFTLKHVAHETTYEKTHLTLGSMLTAERCICTTNDWDHANSFPNVLQYAELTIYRSWFCGGACHQHYRDLRDAFCVCLSGLSAFPPDEENSSFQIMVRFSQNLPTRPCPWLTCPRSFLVLDFLVGYQRWHWCKLPTLAIVTGSTTFRVASQQASSNTHIAKSTKYKCWILASNKQSWRY